MSCQAAIEFGRELWRDREGRIGIVFGYRIPQVFHQLNAFGHRQSPECFQIVSAGRHEQGSHEGERFQASQHGFAAVGSSPLMSHSCSRESWDGADHLFVLS